MIMFGVAEILFSQIPDFDQIWWLSYVAAGMSFTYSSIGLALGISKVVGMYDYVSTIKEQSHVKVVKINESSIGNMFFSFEKLIKNSFY